MFYTLAQWHEELQWHVAQQLNAVEAPGVQVIHEVGENQWRAIYICMQYTHTYLIYYVYIYIYTYNLI